MSEQAPSLRWFDAVEIGVEGKGWADTQAPYDRLPAKAEGVVSEVVWGLSHSATGMCVNFRTNATQIHARWRLRDAQLNENNFNVCSFSGLDLYGDDNGVWRWVAATTNIEGQTPQVCIADRLMDGTRDYRIYLPMRNPVLQLEIGVPDDAMFTPIPPQAKPLVFYGTSIVHGAYASHAGMVYPSILGRRLHQPVINLGFSGNAHMEIELADLLAELDAQVYILDAMPNMDLNLVNERTEPFVRRLRALRPHTPIVMVEDCPRTNTWIMPWKQDEVIPKCRRYREIYEALIADGLSQLSYIEGTLLCGTDGEASIDGIHPGDVGYLRMADIFEPVLRSICEHSCV
jgi:lysophospholipase L1-like esterase